MSAPVVELRDATKTYPGPPELTVLRPTTLAVHAAEQVAVVGPSGSGKSTLLAILGTLGGGGGAPGNNGRLRLGRRARMRRASRSNGQTIISGETSSSSSLATRLLHERLWYRVEIILAWF